MDSMGDPDVLRAGVRPLVILATTLNFLIIRALANGPLRLAELRRATGLPAQTTLRGHLSSLAALGVVAKRPASEMPYAVENELTPAGRELLCVAESLEAWLNRAPEVPLSLETGSGKGVIKAFVDGWGSTILGTLAQRPMSLTELDSVIPALSYPALERRLSSMRMAGLVEAAPTTHGSGTPYAVTEWARQGVAPLVAAGKCEQLQMQPLAAPVTETDVEAAFMLSVPLVGLPREAAGRCHLTVEGDSAKGRGRSGVEVIVEAGTVIGCVTDLASEPGQYATGSPATWFTAVLDARHELLDYAGGNLPVQLVHGLHQALVEPLAAAPPPEDSIPPGAEGAQPAAASSAAASPTNGTSSS
ncbi:MAG TPA: winged helix-turn-helix transcriptional regulator [Solirubrobacterales bacterium]|jgi:DNA-binding HxlR family transcriptional regulator